MLRLSNSEMSCFRRCRRKWWLTYLRGLKPRVSHARGSAISIGNLVHDALAFMYDPENWGADPIAYASAKVETAIQEDPGHEIEILKEWSLCEIMLTGYMEWLEETGEDADLRFIGSERKVEIPMNENVTLISKLDAPVERISDGAKLALEHKTVASLDQPMNLLKIDTQLLTEHLVRFMDAQIKGATPEEAYDECQGILYNMLRKVKRTAAAKPPFYGRETVLHNIHELRNHWHHVLSIANEIQLSRARLENGESHHAVFPPSPAMDCKWSCPFFAICPMFDDNSRVEDAIEAIYEVADPLERYQETEDL